MPTRTKLHYLFSEYFSLSFVILIQNLIEFLGFSTFFLERERERVCVAFGLWSMWRDRRESPFYKWLRNSAFYLGGVYFQGLYRFWTNLGRPYLVPAWIFNLLTVWFVACVYSGLGMLGFPRATIRRLIFFFSFI